MFQLFRRPAAPAPSSAPLRLRVTSDREHIGALVDCGAQALGFEPWSSASQSVVLTLPEGWSVARASEYALHLLDEKGRMRAEVAGSPEVRDIEESTGGLSVRSFYHIETDRDEETVAVRVFDANGKVHHEVTLLREGTSLGDAWAIGYRWLKGQGIDLYDRTGHWD